MMQQLLVKRPHATKMVICWLRFGHEPTDPRARLGIRRYLLVLANIPLNLVSLVRQSLSQGFLKRPSIAKHSPTTIKYLPEVCGQKSDECMSVWYKFYQSSWKLE